MDGVTRQLEASPVSYQIYASSPSKLLSSQFGTLSKACGVQEAGREGCSWFGFACQLHICLDFRQ